MSWILAAFGPADKATAVVHAVALVCFVGAAIAFAVGGPKRADSIGLIALGLALYVFPTVWNEVDAAFH